MSSHQNAEKNEQKAQKVIFLKKPLDFWKEIRYNNLRPVRDPPRIRRSIEVVITSTIGNRVAVMSGTRVRIPPSPPEKSTHLSTKTMCAFFN